MNNIKEIWQRYFQNKNPENAKCLIEYYYSYAIDYVKKSASIFNDILDWNEVESNAGYELIKTIRTYDPEKCPNFLPYLYKRLRWNVIEMLRKADHLSIYERTLIKKYEKEKNCYYGPRKDVKPSDEKICEKLGISLEKLNKIKNKNNFQVISISSMRQEQVDNLLSSMAINMRIPTPNEIAERKEMVKKILNMLTPRYQQMFILRYINECSIAEIAELMGMTPKGIESIFRRQRKALHQQLTGVDEKLIDERILFETKKGLIKRLLKK